MDDVQSYRARHDSRAAGDAVPVRLARDTGRRPVGLQGRAPAVRLAIKSVSPGQSVKLRTWTGRVQPRSITRYEASYAR
jgi:hypothetical protein